MKNKGFTLIELLIAISIIGVLSGVLLTVIDPNAQRNRVRDKLAEKNLADLAGAAEAFHSSEGRYPVSSNEPKFTSYYVRDWPTNEPDGATYTYVSDASGSYFIVLVDLDYRANFCYKASNTSGVVEKCGVASCNLTDATCDDPS